ncbi:hypothetical protein MTX20_02685 [Bradyrhizobium sp. ISRA435]|nr:hypothetical protein MTX20_02685 [Bradyrhizobium sp. ISRA435]
MSPTAAATPEATDISTPDSIISRRTTRSNIASRAISASTSFYAPLDQVDLRQVPLDCGTLVGRSYLGGDPPATANPSKVEVRTGPNEVGVKDRLNEVLQAHPLTHELRTARHSPSQGHSALIGYPDLRKRSGGVQLCEPGSINRIPLDLRACDQPHLHRAGYDNTVDIRCQNYDNGRGTAGRLDNHVIVMGEFFLAKASKLSRVMGMRPSWLDDSRAAPRPRLPRDGCPCQ